jgi:hypothetical protein
MDKHIAMHNRKESQVFKETTHIRKVKSRENDEKIYQKEIPDQSMTSMNTLFADQLTSQTITQSIIQLVQSNPQIATQLISQLVESNIQLAARLTIQSLTQQNIQLAKPSNIIPTDKPIIQTNIMQSKCMIGEQSISYLTYIINNYRDAPTLKRLADYSTIKGGEDDILFVNNTIFNYRTNRLSKTIGDFLIKMYKKDNPEQQSIWVSDVSRLTFIASVNINGNKIEWHLDKKGIKTIEYIINPLIRYMETIIREYLDNPQLSHNNKKSKNYKVEDSEKVYNIKTILEDIDKEVLNNQVLKYIAPYFSILKPQNTDLQIFKDLD